MVKVKLAVIWLFLIIASIGQHANASKNSDLVHVVAQYIMDDITERPEGSVYAPSSSGIYHYQVSWYFKTPNEYYVLEQLKLNSQVREWLPIYSGSEREFTVVNDENGEYAHRVKSCSGSTCSGYVESIITHVSLAPLGPINVIASHNDGMNTISWDENPKTANNFVDPKVPLNQSQTFNSTNAAFYQVAESINGSAFSEIDQVSTTTYQQPVIDNLARRYQIKSCINNDCSQPSMPSNIVNGLGQPQFIDVFNNSFGIELNWQEVIGATHYLVKISVNGGNWVEIESTNLTNFLFENSAQGIVRFSVEACDAEQCYGNSQSSDEFWKATSPICQTLQSSIKTRFRGDQFYISHILKVITAKPIPGLVNVLKANTSIYHQQHWTLTESNDLWQLSSIPTTTGTNSTSGGLHMLCKSTENSSAMLTFSSIDDEIQFQVLAEPTQGNNIQLTYIPPYEVIIDNTNTNTNTVGAWSENTRTDSWSINSLDSVISNSNISQYVKYKVLPTQGSGNTLLESITGTSFTLPSTVTWNTDGSITGNGASNSVSKVMKLEPEEVDLVEQDYVFLLDINTDEQNLANKTFNYFSITSEYYAGVKLLITRLYYSNGMVSSMRDGGFKNAQISQSLAASSGRHQWLLHFQHETRTLFLYKDGAIYGQHTYENPMSNNSNRNIGYQLGLGIGGSNDKFYGSAYLVKSSFSTEEIQGLLTNTTPVLTSLVAQESVFTWNVSLEQTGAYDVYAWWSYEENNTSKASYTINHVNGQEEVIIDQSVQNFAGQWNLLGRYNFAEEIKGAVELSTKNGTTNADAIKLVFKDDIFIDQLSVFQDNKGNLYAKLSDSHSNVFLKLSLVENEWVVTEISVEEWNSVTLFLADYRMKYGQYSGDNQEDIAFISTNNELDIVIEQTENGYRILKAKTTIFIHTDILGTPVAETDSEGDIL